MLSEDDITTEQPEIAGPDFVNHWGGGQDSEIQFWIRTGPDSSANMIQFMMLIPTRNSVVISFLIYYIDGKVMFEMYVDSTPYYNFVIDISTSFQHIRIVWRNVEPTTMLEFWLNAEMKLQKMANHFPAAGDIEIQSQVLRFFDGFREISNFHLSSTTADICQCSSQCVMGYYGSNCIQCPNMTTTMRNGSIDIKECLCIFGYHRSDRDDIHSCVPNVQEEFASYNVSQGKMRGHCVPAFQNPGRCTKQLLYGNGVDGCSCQDDCVYATGDQLPCCRNKCSVCPNNNDQSADLSRQQKICECTWDDEKRRSYNKLRPSDEWDGLCSGAYCDNGQKSRNGFCVACPAETYRPRQSDISVCITCPKCGYNQFMQGCSGGSNGSCVQCTECPDGLIEATPCSFDNDRTCRNMSSCEDTTIALRNECAEGTYHAACDPVNFQPGWCESCPIQHAEECPAGFFLDFNCTKDAPLSTVPNQCVPCNRFSCELEDTYPSADDCGVLEEPNTMKAETIQCSNKCAQPEGDVWIVRHCQYTITRKNQPELMISEYT